jgi:hypothetical protein
MAPVDYGLKSKNHPERAEKKADHLIPEAVHRLDDGGKDVFYKRTALFDGLALPHDFIVTKPPPH